MLQQGPYGLLLENSKTVATGIRNLILYLDLGAKVRLRGMGWTYDMRAPAW